MKCPACKEEMIILELEQVEIDHCTFCGGIWLDEGELELLMDGAAHRDRLLSSFAPATSCREMPRSCPRCRKKMQKVNAGLSAEVLIDTCRRGHGIWFDHGELQQVMQLGGMDPDNKVAGLLNEMFKHRSDK